ncbi:aminotransferase class I/II-fold pyridoxal phosphate-dependent enzyme [Paracoccaceae bacterium GXU_MW_L88]
MQFPERFSDLPDYAFPRLRALLDPHEPGGDVLHMSIGEPKHPFPAFVIDEINRHADGFNKYPPNDGAPELLAAIEGWLKWRYGVDIPHEGIMALNGTREGLFNACLALCPEQKNGQRPAVLLPNPFYQCYAAATLAAGAEPVYVPATAETGFLPDYSALPKEILDRAAIAYLCAPSNPQGAIATGTYWRDLIALADAHDFRLFADECYSEIYRGEPPRGALETAAQIGADPERVLIFHSLSKRSSAPGLRSGFVAGGVKSVAAIRKLRSYGGAPLPLPLQMAAARLWADEEHVTENRARYVGKYEIADEILGNLPGYTSPEAGFFLWLDVGDGEDFALRLWKNHGVRVLPGAYLSRESGGTDPGARYIRVALVAEEDEITRGLTAIRTELTNRG